MPLYPIKKALISVSDKTGLIELASQLQRCDVKILSTGGTAKHLVEHGIVVEDVARYTGFPEIMGGRVKTLHPKIAGGLLARREFDEDEMALHGIDGIDLLVVNLYPFAKTIANPDCDFADAIEQIDIGGPTMLRAAAKNCRYVTAIVDPNDYGLVIDALAAGKQGLEDVERRSLMVKVFNHTAHYDSVIARYMAKTVMDEETSEYSNTMVVPLNFRQSLRYGENPHQSAALYGFPQTEEGASLATAKLVQGKPLSFNNLLDAEAALNCIRPFTEPTCVIVKHNNACGVAIDENITNAYHKAFNADPQSAFGGVIAVNVPIDASLAHSIIENQFVEVIISFEIESQAIAVIAKKPNVRVILIRDGMHQKSLQRMEFRSIDGGMLVQQQDNQVLLSEGIKTVTNKHPSDSERNDLLFAWNVVKSLKSNAIVLARDQTTFGVGCGQTSRVFALQSAVARAQEIDVSVAGCVMASDAFFPFKDSIDFAAEHNISAIIQPGGSQRDQEVIEAANEKGITMVFTAIRHFKH